MEGGSERQIFRGRAGLKKPEVNQLLTDLAGLATMRLMQLMRLDR